MSINATRRQHATPDEIKKAVCDAAKALKSTGGRVSDAMIAARAAGRIGISDSVVRNHIRALSDVERTVWRFPDRQKVPAVSTVQLRPSPMSTRHGKPGYNFKDRRG